MRKRTCDKCKREILSADNYIKCVEVGEKKDNWVRTMNGVGDLCLKCWGDITGNPKKMSEVAKK